jgi:rhomboid protease GluP
MSERPLPPSFEAIVMGGALDREASLDAFVVGLDRGARLTLTLVTLLFAIHLGVGMMDYASGRYTLWQAVGYAPTQATIEAAGARVPQAVALGQTWRLISCTLLHGDWFHLAVNCLALFGLGRICEAIFGSARLLTLFVVAGLGGSILSQLGPSAIALGASGAAFGLAGAGMVFGWRHRLVLPYGLRKLLTIWLPPMIVLNLIVGSLVPRIDNLGHIGGLIAGTICALLMRDRIVPGEPQSASNGGALAGLSAGVLGWSLMNAGWSILGTVAKF